MKNAFINAAGVLTGIGYAEANNDDRKIEVPDDIDMHPGEWLLVNDQWELTHPELTLAEQRVAAITLLSSSADSGE